MKFEFLESTEFHLTDNDCTKFIDNLIVDGFAMFHVLSKSEELSDMKRAISWTDKNNLLIRRSQCSAKSHINILAGLD